MASIISLLLLQMLYENFRMWANNGEMKLMKVSFQLIIHNVEINIFCMSTRCNAECKACIWSVWFQMVYSVSQLLPSGHVLLPCFFGQEAGKGRCLLCPKDQGVIIRNQIIESHFKSLNAYNFSALSGSFLPLLQSPERSLSLFGFHVCFLILHCFSQQLHCRNRPPAPCSYGNEMITYLLVFWDGSYFIKGN